LRTGGIPAEALDIQSLRQALKVFVLKGMLFERAPKPVRRQQQSKFVPHLPFSILSLRSASFLLGF
jgi:hypothetical protein